MTGSRSAPFSFLYSSSLAAIEAPSKKKTVVMIAHRLKNIEHADLIPNVDHGLDERVRTDKNNKKAFI